MRLHKQARAAAARRRSSQPPAAAAPSGRVAADARACDYLRQQCATYETSVGRLTAATSQLQEEVALYGHTLEQVRPASEGKQAGRRVGV